MSCAKCAHLIGFCHNKMMPCNCIDEQNKCQSYEAEGTSNGETVSIGKVLELYKEMCGASPSRHQKKCINTFKNFVNACGLSMASSITDVNYDTIDRYVNGLSMRSVSKIAVCYNIQTILGRKARAFYRRKGYSVNPVDIPHFEDDSKAYRTLPHDMLMKVLKWYHDLQFDKDSRKRIFAMMMMRYAMRNSDVVRLKWSNFEVNGDQWRLVYIPHKTEKATAGRSVSIWVSNTDQIELAKYRDGKDGDEFVIPRNPHKWHGSLFSLQTQMNREIRALGFNGSKRLYELRKLCIDTVFHTMGAEAASAYSGDDYNTIKFHYADPSSLNLNGVSDTSFGSLGMKK